MGTVLIVDDEPNILKVFAARLGQHNHEVLTCLTAEDAMERLASSKVDVLISDYMLPGESGMSLLKEVKHTYPNTAVIMMTAYGSIEMAVEAMKRGAYDYLTKPVDYAEMCVLIDRAIRERNASGPKTPARSPEQFASIIGKSPEMQTVFETIRQVADSRATILVVGESGTGKELVARALHTTSIRKNAPFVAVNCTAIPEMLLENELFGHEKGSYTGAHRRDIGKFELADGGTLFLDEIAGVSSAVQAKLLRVLQERCFQRIGGAKEVKVDIRVVASTQKNLEDLVQAGAFRDDLYYRLNVISIKLPPLRERRQDIPLLARHFLSKYSEQNGKQISSFSPEAMKALIAYDWPGNVRELENAVERAVVMCSLDRIVPKNLRKSIISASSSSMVLADMPSDGVSLKKLESVIILRALERNSWNQSATAKFLKITRKQLRTKMKHYGLLQGASIEGESNED
ncbi:MAG: sigma-54-dependent Fis family transcriptional regulator [Candidatus Coatesbacteria bacterium]|nr:sigma-54-dependent Fis family transcriptional regulator [Candidatus Coatesbacteria bacterium]